MYMYELLDKGAAVREVQKYLHTVSDRIDPEIPRIAVDGVWGDETEEAVNVFKRKYGLSEGARVDLETFDLLYSLYKGELDDIDAEDNYICCEGFPLSVGVQNHDVTVLHSILSELRREYPTVSRAPRGNYYSDDTARAVSDMQRIFGYGEDGITDKFLFYRLLDELRFIRLLNEIYD